MTLKRLKKENVVISAPLLPGKLKFYFLSGVGPTILYCVCLPFVEIQGYKIAMDKLHHYKRGL